MNMYISWLFGLNFFVCFGSISVSAQVKTHENKKPKYCEDQTTWSC